MSWLGRWSLHGAHYLWLNIAAEKFTLFVVVTKNMDPTPSTETGIWSEENVIVEQIENYYHHRHFVLVVYFVKVITQLLFAVPGLLLAILIFNDANGNFYCPRTFNSSTIPNFWPLNHRVECTFAYYARWLVSKLWVVFISVGIIFNVAEFCLCMCFFGHDFVLMHTLHLAIDFCLLKNFYAGIFQGDTIFRDTVFRDIIFLKTLFHLGILFHSFSFGYTFFGDIGKNSFFGLEHGAQNGLVAGIVSFQCN